MNQGRGGGGKRKQGKAEEGSGEQGKVQEAWEGKEEAGEASRVRWSEEGSQGDEVR